MHVTIRATPWKGDAATEPGDAWGLLVRGIVVDGEELLFEYHPPGQSSIPVCAIEWEADGSFLTATFRGITESSYHAFMRERSPNDVLDGTGTRITSDGEIVGLAWYPGDELRVPVTNLDVEYVDP